MFFGRKTIKESIFVKKNAVIEMLSGNLNEQLRTAKGECCTKIVVLKQWCDKFLFFIYKFIRLVFYSSKNLKK